MFRTVLCIVMIFWVQTFALEQEAKPVADSTAVIQPVSAEAGAVPSVDPDGVSVPSTVDVEKKASGVSRPAPKNKQVAANDEAARDSIRKIKLIKRQYDYHQQFVLAISMMAFIAVMMASTQNWNPE